MVESRWDAMGFGGRIARLPYFAIGAGLSAVKMGVDFLVARLAFGREWSPWNYVNPFPGRVGGLFSMDRADQVYSTAMLAVALPFLFVGVVLTVRRLRDVGWPPWVAALFFAPAPINLVFLLILSGERGRPPKKAPEAWDDAIDGPRAVKGAGPAPVGMSLGRAMAAILIPMPVAGLVAFFLTHVWKSYGWTLFLGIPFGLPMLSVILYGYNRPIVESEALRIALIWLLTALLLMLAVGYEGMICILMALPLAFPIVLLGAMVGYLMVGFRTPRSWVAMVLLATLPAMAGAEHLARPKPPTFACRTSVEVDAPPSKVWREVLAFPDLDPPGDLLFRSGIAYPVRARIEGSGEGAVRHCEFSTGAFVEPIEVWDEPRLLRFAVTSCPPPMREWNPFFEVRPPHLEGFLVSERGQFLLTELPGGRTRLEGTTWYRHGLWPAGYWRLWSDAILHRIHARVLGHIKGLAERDPR